MDQEIKKIMGQVGDIGEKLSRLLGEASVPAIEKDILIRDIQDLYTAVKELKEQPRPDAARRKDKAGEKAAVKEPAARDAAAAVEETVPPVEETLPPVKETVPPAEEPVPEPPAETEKEGDGAGTESSGSAEPVKKKSGGEKPKPGARPQEPEILADKYKSNTAAINESLAGKQQDVSSKIQSTPITSIGSALGINDRFKLINELFNGDKDSFQNTCRALDDAANFNEAFSYISSSFDWDMEDESVKLLLDLVRRKFIVTQDE